MELGNRDSVWRSCEELGEAAVRARIDSGSFGSQSLLPREWLLEQAEKRRATKETEERERNQRALAAAEASARASEQAAEASRKSARWTMWAAVAALLSAAVSAAVPYFSR